MANEIIRTAAKQAGIKLWVIAEACGMTDSSFSRKLRHELPEEKQAEILSTIKQLSNDQEVS